MDKAAAEERLIALKDKQGDLSVDALKLAMETLEKIVETRKVRVAFWEKLIILDGATLALSLTAFNSLHNLHRFPHDGAVGYFKAAWLFILLSGISALLAQWFTTETMTAEYFSIHAVQRYMFRALHQVVHKSEAAIAETEKAQQAIKKTTDDSSQIRRWTRAFQCICAACTLLGFFMLYRYVINNV